MYYNVLEYVRQTRLYGVHLWCWHGSKTEPKKTEPNRLFAKTEPNRTESEKVKTADP